MIPILGKVVVQSKKEFLGAFSAILVGLLVAFSFYAMFQSRFALAETSDFSVEATPESPKSFETITFRLKSFTVDLNRAVISWTVNGKTAESGIGKTSFNFQTGKAGTSYALDISVKDSGLGVLTKRLSFRVGEVDLLWEATNSYVPPFYKGKAMPSSQSSVKFVAVPNLFSGSKKLSPDELVYRWKRNDKYRELNDQSGYGKKSVLINGDLIKSGESVEVEASSLNNGSAGQGSALFSYENPLIIFYEDRPAEGISYNRAIGEEFSLPNKESTILAVPYFFSAKTRESAAISYSWKVGDKSVNGTDGNRGFITLREEGGSRGSENVSLSINHVSKVLQEAVAGFTVNFGEGSGGANFFNNQ